MKLNFIIQRVKAFYTRNRHGGTSATRTKCL